MSFTELYMEGIEMLITLQNQKMKVDKQLSDEMLKHLAKMMSK